MPGTQSYPASPPPTVIKLPQPCQLGIALPDGTSGGASDSTSPAAAASRDRRHQGAPKETPRKLVPDFILAMWQHLSPRKTPARPAGAAAATAAAGWPSKLGESTRTHVAPQPAPASAAEAGAAAAAAAAVPAQAGAAPLQKAAGVQRAADAPAAATAAEGQGQTSARSTLRAEAKVLCIDDTAVAGAAISEVPCSAGSAGTNVTARPPAVTQAAIAAAGVSEQRRACCRRDQAELQLSEQAEGGDLEEGELPMLSTSPAANSNNSLHTGAGRVPAAPAQAAPLPAASVQTAGGSAQAHNAACVLQQPPGTAPAGASSSTTSSTTSSSGDSTNNTAQPSATPPAAAGSAHGHNKVQRAAAQGSSSPPAVAPASSKGQHAQRSQHGASKPAAAGKRSEGKGKGSKVLAVLRRTLQPGKGSKEIGRRSSRQRSPSPAAVSTLVESMAQQAEQLQQQLEALTLVASGGSGGSVVGGSGGGTGGAGEGSRQQASGADVGRQLATLTSQLSQLTLCLHSMQGMQSAGANPFAAALSAPQPPAPPGSDIAGRLFVVFDTNVFIHHLDLVKDWWRALQSHAAANTALLLQPIGMLMPLAVIRELDGLKNSIRHYFAARRATAFLHEEVLGKWQYRGQREDELHQGYNPRGDDGILHCMLYMRARGAQVELCSEDRNLQLRAATEGMAYYAHRAALPTLQWHLAKQQYYAQHYQQQAQQQQQGQHGQQQGQRGQQQQQGHEGQQTVQQDLQSPGTGVGCDQQQQEQGQHQQRSPVQGPERQKVAPQQQLKQCEASSEPLAPSPTLAALASEQSAAAAAGVAAAGAARPGLNLLQVQPQQQKAQLHTGVAPRPAFFWELMPHHQQQPVPQQSLAGCPPVPTPPLPPSLAVRTTPDAETQAAPAASNQPLQQQGPPLPPQQSQQQQQRQQAAPMQARAPSRPAFFWDVTPSGKENHGGGVSAPGACGGQSGAAATATKGGQQAPAGKPAARDRAPMPAAADRAPLPALHPAYLQGKR